MGSVALVGAGPGSADLLTIRAVRAIEQATVVLHDRLVGRGVLDLVPPSAEVIDVGKRPGDVDHQSTISELMVTKAEQGHRIVRLKGGDPMVFGRGGEELAFLRAHGIPTEVVPGITSAIGVPTALGLPVTLRGVASGFAVVAGEVLDGEGARRYADVDTLVILMGARRRSEIAEKLIASGRPESEPVAFIENGSTADERVTVATLGSVRLGAVDVAAPVVWICGRVVDMLDP